MSAAMPLKVSLHAGGKTTYLTYLTDRISWSGSIAECGRTCTINFKNTLDDGDSFVVKGIECGQEIRCVKRTTEFFRGIIFKIDRSSDGSTTIVAYDSNYYLAKNKDSKVFRNKTASQIVSELCKQYGIKHGKIDNTGYVIPKLILRDKTLYDMITIALTETRKKTGKVFMLHNEGGVLILRERKSQVVQLVVSRGSNLLGASYSESIEDMKNSVRITGAAGEDSRGVSVSDAASIRKYGTMREKVHEGEKKGAELKPIAQALLKELSTVAQSSRVEAIGDTSIRAGRSIRIYDKMTGLVGGYYVSADDHSLEANGTHRMTLTLSRTLDVEEMEYEEPSENAKPATTPAKGNSGGGGGSSGPAKDGKAPNSTKADAVVSLARSYVGRLRYVFGGKSIVNGTGDCSGFSLFVYKRAAGINLGHGTSSQIGKGTRVSQGNARPGDVVFFQGTYRAGVSHVGIVTRPGYCVSLASSGCKEHSYVSGYWGNHFMQIRRVL